MGRYVGTEGERKAMGIEGRVRKGDWKTRVRELGKGKEKAWEVEDDAMDVS